MFWTPTCDNTRGGKDQKVAISCLLFRGHTSDPGHTTSVVRESKYPKKNKNFCRASLFGWNFQPKDIENDYKIIYREF